MKTARSAACSASCPDTGWALQRLDQKHRIWRWVYVGTCSYGKRTVKDLRSQIRIEDLGSYRFVRVTKWRGSRYRWRASFDKTVGPVTKMTPAEKPRCYVGEENAR